MTDDGQRQWWATIRSGLSKACSSRSISKPTSGSNPRALDAGGSMTGTDDQEPTGPAGASPQPVTWRPWCACWSSAVGTPKARPAWPRRGDIGSSSCSHQQQVQIDINAQRRQQAEDAYQQVPGCLARVAAELQHTGGADAEALTASAENRHG